MKKIILFILTLIPVTVFAQNNIATGTWRTHYSFNSMVSVTQNDTEVFAASGAGIFTLAKSDLSISSFTKLNGLSATGITQIGYNPSTSTLIIAYSNGQIDLLKDNKITSIPDIRLSEILDSKITNHIYSQGMYCYLSTDFGVVLLDTENQSIKDSYLKLSETGNDLKIYASVVYNDSLFLATETGMIAGSFNDNLKDFAKWKRFDMASGISQEPLKVLSLYQNKPLTGNETTGLFTYDNGAWTSIGVLPNEQFHSIENIGLDILITTETGIYRFSNSILSTVESPYVTNPVVTIGDNSALWVADSQNGVVRISGTNSESLYPNGPYFNKVARLESFEGKVFALPEFKTEGGQPLRNTVGFSLFEDGLWTNYNSTGYPQTKAIPEFLDISSVASFGNGAVFSSYGYGLMTWEDNTFTILDETNSPLINSFPPDRYVFVQDLASDKQGTWVLNNNSISSSLHLLNTDNTWTSFVTSNTVANASRIVTTPWGEPWITIDPGSGGGIYVYNTNGSSLTLLNSGTGTIPSNTVNDIMLDKEDKMWVATSKGVVYYPYPYDILNDPNQEAITPIIDFRLLFFQKNVNALAVDGGNRIWMGTNEGAWLFDKDGTELIEHFNTENSPILSDVVNDITINNLTGEVFFNTDAGLISYRGSGTVTGTYKTPKIFPNPVPPGFNGVVTIEGVPSNSSLKITDSSGRLVAQIEANGNSAIWDFQNAHLSDVGTGVYFVFVSLEDGSEHQFGKIAIVK